MTDDEKVRRIELHDWNMETVFQLAELGLALGRKVVVEVSVGD